MSRGCFEKGGEMQADDTTVCIVRREAIHAGTISKNMMTWTGNESEAVRLVRDGNRHFDTFKRANLWLACERLLKRGAFKAGPIANSYDIACPVCCQDEYQPCPQHPKEADKRPDWVTPLGVNEYVSGRHIKEHALDTKELEEIYGTA